MEDFSAAYYHHPPQPATHHYPYYPPPSSAAAPPPQHPPPHFHAPPPYPHHQHPYDAPVYARALPPPQPPQDEVRTLFIAGLPDDVKHREIYNLFREFPGYQSCNLRTSGQSAKAYGFAVFTDQRSAVTAMHALNGMVFDLEKEATLHIDLAKSNSKSKRSRTDDEGPYSSDKKIRGSVAYSRGFLDSGVGSNIHMPGMGNSGYSTNAYPSAQSHANFPYEAVNDVDPHKLAHRIASAADLSMRQVMLGTPLACWLGSSARPSRQSTRTSKKAGDIYNADTWSTYTKSTSTPYVPQNSIPCPTLFVARLGPACSEQELTQVFSRCPGFLKLKMQNKNGVPVAFVDFQDTTSSTGALNQLQGTVLYSSDGEGMRLEYAKARMGLRRRDKTT